MILKKQRDGWDRAVLSSVIGNRGSDRPRRPAHEGEDLGWFPAVNTFMGITGRQADCFKRVIDSYGPANFSGNNPLFTDVLHHSIETHLTIGDKAWSFRNFALVSVEPAFQNSGIEYILVHPCERYSQLSSALESVERYFLISGLCPETPTPFTAEAMNSALCHCLSFQQDYLFSEPFALSGPFSATDSLVGIERGTNGVMSCVFSTIDGTEKIKVSDLRQKQLQALMPAFKDFLEQAPALRRKASAAMKRSGRKSSAHTL